MRACELQIIKVLLQSSEILVKIHETHVHQINQVCLVIRAEIGWVKFVDVIDFVHFADVEVWNVYFRLINSLRSWIDLLCLWSKGFWDLRIALSHRFVLVIFNDGVLNQNLRILGLFSNHDLLSRFDFFDHCFWLNIDGFVQVFAFVEEICALFLDSIRLFGLGFSFICNNLWLWCLRCDLCNFCCELLLLDICCVRVGAHQILWSMSWVSDF